MSGAPAQRQPTARVSRRCSSGRRSPQFLASPAPPIYMPPQKPHLRTTELQFYKKGRNRAPPHITQFIVRDSRPPNKDVREECHRVAVRMRVKEMSTANR